jgi:CBS domain-containing protein
MTTEFTAKDVMSRRVLTVPPEMTVHELAAFLTENQISGAPVVDGRGRLVGLASLTDIAESDDLRAGQARPDSEGSASAWAGRANTDETRGLRLEGPDLTVGDIMTPAAYMVPEDTPVADLARTMVAGRIHRLLVGHEHRVVGIVTSLDLLRLLYETAPGREPGGRGRTVIVR